MQYQYRWLYAIAMSFLLVAAGYYYDLRDKFIHLADLQQMEKESREKCVTAKSLHKPTLNPSFKPAAVEYNAVSGISNIVNLAHINGLSIQSIKVVSTVGDRMIHFIAQGQFQPLYSFISSLEREAEIQHFSCSLTKQQQLQIQADILLHKSATQPTMHSHFKVGNPFCSSANINGLRHRFPLIQMQSTPIRLMKMVGYLHQAQRTEALILLPNTDLVAIHRGSRLGEEQATVTEIQPNRVELKGEDKTYDIKMST